MKSSAVSCKQLGDTLLLQPALALLARRGGCDVALLTKPGFAPLVKRMPGARLPEPDERFDDLWVFEHGSKAALRAFLTQAACKRLRLLRLGYRRWFHPLVFHDIQAQPLHYRYRALCHYRAVSGSEEGFTPPVLDATGLGEPPAGIPGGALVASPTSAWESKAWTPSAWAAFLDAAAARTGLPIVLVGQGGDWVPEHIRRIRARTRCMVIDLVNRTSLDELLAVVASARVVVGIDGAVLHIAAALQRRVLAMFGPTRVEEWFWPTERSVAVRPEAGVDGRVPLSELPTEAVLDKLGDLLAV